MPNSVDQYQQRYGEVTCSEFSRTGRFFYAKGNWYFKTREGINYGPFISRTECKYAYAEFIDVVSNTNELSSSPIDFESGETEWKMPKISFS